jgi:hypothetical protein
VTFFDSRLFDSSLSEELAPGADAVEVVISGKVSLNKSPQRTDQWLTTVGETANGP